MVSLFTHPGELSARSGEALYKAFSGKENLLLQQAQQLHEQKTAGVIFEPEEVISLLTAVLKEPSGKKVNLSTRHQFVPGATALYKGDKVIFNLDKSRLPEECIKQIESILRDLQKV